jgi:hypothetical protein
MPRNLCNADRILILDDNLQVVAAPPRRSQRRKRARRLQRPRQFPAPPAMEPALLPSDSIMRFRRLLMAALRVWELKHGIHDHY